MCNTTRIGAIALVVSLVVLRFGHALPLEVGLAGALIGLAILAAGLVQDRRTRQSVLEQPAPNWAEEFTAQVRRERAAAVAARETSLTGEAAAN